MIPQIKLAVEIIVSFVLATGLAVGFIVAERKR